MAQDLPFEQVALPKDTNVDILLEYERLRGYYLVTSVTKCTAYASYLGFRGACIVCPYRLSSSRPMPADSNTVSLGLYAHTPIETSKDEGET